MQQTGATQKQTDVQPQRQHDAFISYSRKNEAFADCLEQALASYSPPRGLAAPQRRLKIFRDKRDFTGTEYHRSLEMHLTDSAKLIVVCSPEACQSQYVNDEIRQFARLKGVGGIIPVLCSGIPNNEVKPGQEAQRAFPAALCQLMAMPLAADFRGVTPKKTKINSGIYRDAWYTTLANIFDIPRAEIEERDRKRRQRTRRITSTVTAVILCLIAVAITVAWRSRLQAQKQARDAAQLQYIGNIVRAQQAYEGTDLPGMRRLLQAVIPASSNPTDDFRGFEWYYLWRLSQGPTSAVVANDDAARSVAFSPDGRLFATGGEDGIVKLWSADSRKELSRLGGQGGAVIGLAFSPDGKMLATAANTHVKLWDVSSRTLAAEINGLGDPVQCISFSPAAPLLAAVGYEQMKKMVRVWDLRSQRVTSVLTGEGTASASNMFAAFSPDGSMLAFSSGYGVQISHFPSGEKMAEFDGPGIYVSAITFSPDGKMLVAAADNGKLVFFDLKTRRKSAPLEAHQDYVSSLGFSPDGRLLITASADKTIKQWDAATHQLRIEWKGHTGPVQAIAISADGRTVASVSQDKTVRLWDVSARSEYEEKSDLGILMESIAPSPRDNRIALASASTVVVWDPSGRKELARLPNHSQAIANVAFSPDQKTIAIGSSGETVELWDTISGRVEALQAHTAQVYGVAFSPDGKWLAAASDDNTVRVWNMSARQAPPASLTSHTKAVTAVAFSPDGKTLASGSDDGTVKLWDVGSWHELASSPAFATPPPGADAAQHLLTALSFAPNGELLAAAGTDGTAILWRVTSRTLQKLGPLAGHTAAINYLVFSPDGRTIATASSDTTVKLWHPLLLRELMTIKEPKGSTEVPHFLMGSENQVAAVGFSSDGKFLVTGLNDGTIRFRRAATTSEGATDQQK